MRLLVDSASLYYRSFYALPESMTAPDGRPHNAIRGFLSTMARLVDAQGARELICAWDADWRPQWRVDLLPTYKAHRVIDEAGDDEQGSSGTEETPETLSPQVDGLARILDAMGIARPWAEAHEADDVLATLAGQAGGPAIVVSGDRDLVQLVGGEVRVLLAVNGGMEKWPLLDDAGVLERFGVPARAYVDFAIMRGDPSDGIPGVPGIGAKTAAALIERWGGIDGILEAAGTGGEGLTARRATALLDAEPYLRAARVVATAVRGLELSNAVPAADQEALAAIAERWGVGRQVAELQRALELAGGQ